ncbi:MAG: hypothetical protein R3F60_29140 [bacterium]
MLLNSFLWFNSAVLNQAVNGLGGPDYLAVPADAKVELSYLLTTISVGIIAGSLAAPRLAARFSLGRVVFLGAGGMAALQIGLLLIGPVVGRDTGGFPVALSLLFAIGFAGALAIVSVQSWLQDAPPAGMRGQTFAANNFLNFLFMFFAGGFYLLSNLVGPTFTQLGGAAVLVLYLVRIRRSVAPMAIGGAT